ncbi:MAG: hypothetical protein ACRCUS_09225 [Anaerovoracaceae bacterium]
MKGFKLKNVNKAMYWDMLAFVGHECRDFEMVEANDESLSVVEDRVKQDLKEYCVGYKYVKKWVGTKGGGGLMHVYTCIGPSVAVLKKYDSFFDYSLDLAFYKNGRPMLYTISHEKYISGIKDYWEKFFVQDKKRWGKYILDTFNYLDDKIDDEDKDRSNLKKIKSI